MTVTAADYRAVMRRHPAGVAIITLASAKGPVGFTATSFASLSLDPPLMSFNITHSSSSLTALQAAKSVVVHLPSADQLGTAQRFSRAAAERFADETLWSPLETGEPVLNGTPTWMRVMVMQLIPIGDSSLVIGEVTRVCCVNDGDEVPTPLVYHNGTFSGTSHAQCE